MGLFSSKSTTHVSSVVYNMAGDVKDRANYLSTLVAGHVLGAGKATLTRNMLDSYLSGPGINLRRFGRWAELYGYNDNVGLVQSTVTLPSEVNTAALAVVLKGIYGKDVLINEADIGPADYGIWANQYMLANQPSKYLSNWTATYDEASNKITIQIPGENPIKFTPTNFVPTARYLYVSLNQVGPGSTSVVAGDVIPGPFTPTEGYQESVAPTTQTVDLSTTVTVKQTDTGKDPVTNVIQTPGQAQIELNTRTYTKVEKLPDLQSVLAVGQVTLVVTATESVKIVLKTTTGTVVEQLSPGVTRTTETTRVDQIAEKETTHQLVTTTTKNKTWGQEEILIYRQGSGNPSLDAFFTSQVSLGSFFPSIPIRLNNRFISENYYAGILPWVKKAVRRATNSTFEKLVDRIADNPSLGDIDYAYIVFGASLNTPENAAKQYLYEFFSQASTVGGSVSITAFLEKYRAALASWDAWVIWYGLNRSAVDENGQTINSLPEPVRLPLPNMPTNFIRIRSSQNYNIGISYSGIDETVHPGKYSPNAKLQSLRVYKGRRIPLYAYRQRWSSDDSSSSEWEKVVVSNHETVVIEWQHTADSYRRLVISDLMHRNYVYDGKAVWISGWEALSDLDESGFIVPLQDEILRRMPLPVSTQLCTASTYLMFNCYQVVKQKWYQTGIFKLVVVIVAIAISIYTGGASAGASGGLLGSNAVVGAAIGFTGTAAIVAGAIANAVVAMVATQVISAGAKALFGDKLGSIIGAIASLAAVSIGTSMANGQGFSMSFGNMLKAENIFQLTSAIGNGVSGYIQASTAEIQNQTAQVLDEYKEQSKAIAERFMEEFGSTGFIDPLAVVGLVPFKLEDPAVFLERTLMTGTDIADISQNMLDNFTDLTLSLPLE